MTVRDSGAATLALWRPATKPRHLRRKAAFIDINQMFGSRPCWPCRAGKLGWVEKYDVILDAEFAHACRQALAIGFALITNQIWMRRAEHDINGIRTSLDNGRHDIDHDLDAFVSR